MYRKFFETILNKKSYHIDRQVQTNPFHSLIYRNHRVYYMKQTQHSDTGTGSWDHTNLRSIVLLSKTKILVLLVMAESLSNIIKNIVVVL